MDAAVQAGADAIGLVLYEQSPRHVTPRRAAELARRLPPFVTPVLLVVNASAALIEETLHAVPHGVLQFHGDETPDQCLRSARPYLRAARMAPGFNLLDFAQQHPQAQAMLVDAHVDGYGGGGQVFDWSLLPKELPCPLILSGGLHPGNVAEAVKVVRPWGVDVSSGVESSRGVKDAALIHRFCLAVREADQLAQSQLAA